MLRVRSTDDRGKPVHLYRTGLLPVPRAGEHEVPREVWPRVRLKVGQLSWSEPGALKGVPFRAWVSMLVIAAMPGALGLICCYVAHLMDAVRYGVLFMYVPLLGAYLLFVWWRGHNGIQEMRPTVVIRGMLSHLLCPQCGYSLRSAPAAADGCTVCPECGSAWRVVPGVDP